ncbi:hypothetical protein DFH07DRAFT_943068 [Mycena maculata]|uniref:Uncharacterized protein n=1 Tax=Mycena maculata TaxID=230809 RepID=A0AAD7IJ42_9AGAR|nr:hypothetical protein DFH07DRAFT_943068 [Mycena maculata]
MPRPTPQVRYSDATTELSDASRDAATFIESHVDIASTSRPCPAVPPDLERDIFETAAEINPEGIPSLLLVCHRVHTWCRVRLLGSFLTVAELATRIEKIQYRTFICDHDFSGSSSNLLLKAIQSKSKPPSFFHGHVRHLFVRGGRWTESELNNVLSTCGGIQSLVFLRGVTASLLPSLGAMKLRRLGLYLEELFLGMDSINLAHPAFSFITHFEIFGGMENIFGSFPGFSWSLLALLPCLAHFALDELNNLAVTTELFANCKKFEVGVSMYPFESDFENDDLLSIDDARFYSADWLLGTRGGRDFWARAVTFVAKKRRGEIKPGVRLVTFFVTEALD